MSRSALIALILVAQVLLAGLLVSPALAQKRVALVIGNDNYATLRSLNNAVRDARDMAATLERLGFEVILKTNARSKDFGRALRAFEGKLTSADTALVFYAGHGIQADGHNYLIPSDADVEVEADLEFEAIKTASVMNAIQRAGVPLNIVILDACRDNPLPRRTRSASRGLAVVAVPQGTKGSAVVYSAAPGETAQDGPKGGNGVFTGELLKAMEKPGLKLEDVLKETTRRVLEKTGGKQRPFINASLTGDFYFKEGPAPRAPVGVAVPNVAVPNMAVGGGVDKEALFWQTIQGSTDPADYEDYIAQFPNGTFAGRAKRLAKKYARTPSAAVSSAPVPARPRLTFSIQALDETLVAVKAANVRAEPTASAVKVTTLRAGTEVSATGQTTVDGAPWYRIAVTGGGSAYVLGSLLKKKGQVAQRSIEKLRGAKIWVRSNKPSVGKKYCRLLEEAGLIVECDANFSESPMKDIVLKCPTLPADAGELIQAYLGISGFKIYDWRNDPDFGLAYCEEFDAISFAAFE